MQRCCELARCFIAVSNQRARQLVKKNKLHAPGEEAYKHLKAAVSGGPSIVFTRYHEAGVTRIRSHENKQQLNPANGYWAMMQMLSISAQC